MSSDYNTHRYPTHAQPQLHVDNLYATGRIHGLEPPAVDRSRILEIGCGDGMNLIPMAMELPEAQFVGVDYALQPVEEGRAMAARFGLSNVRLHHADICELADDFGEYDYIIAHGFYSWVPDAARDALWRVAKGSLAENGLLFVSYNVLPGWHQSEMIRDFALLERQRRGDSPEALQELWAAVGKLASLKDTGFPLAAEAARISAKSPSVVFHDEFQESTRPFRFREILDRAKASGFRYTGDGLRRSKSGLQAEPGLARYMEEAAGQDAELFEEYLDIFSLQRFRQSIFSKESHAPGRSGFQERVAPLWMRASIAVGEPNSEGERIFENPADGLRFSSNVPPLAALFEQLAACYPSSVPVGKTALDLFAENSGWGPETQETFWTLFERVSMMGAVTFSPRNLPMPRAVTLWGEARPSTTRLARYEAAAGVEVTSRFHSTLRLSDPMQQALVLLLDGTRTLAGITEDLRVAVKRQQKEEAHFVLVEGVAVPLLSSMVFQQQAAALGSSDALRGLLDKVVRTELEAFRRRGLIEPLSA